MTRGEIMRGLSMAMTLQNVTKGEGKNAGHYHPVTSVNQHIQELTVTLLVNGPYATLCGHVVFDSSQSGTQQILSVPSEFAPATKYYFRGGNGNLAQNAIVNGYLDNTGVLTATMSGHTYFTMMLSWIIPDTVVTLDSINQSISCEGKIAVFGNMCSYHDRLTTTGLREWNTVGIIPSPYKIMPQIFSTIRSNPFVSVVGSSANAYRDAQINEYNKIDIFMYDNEMYDIDYIWRFR